MIVLDTRVVSELMRVQPAPSVLEWISAQPTEQLRLCSVLVAEMRYGLGRTPHGLRKGDLLFAV